LHGRSEISRGGTCPARHRPQGNRDSYEHDRNPTHHAQGVAAVLDYTLERNRRGEEALEESFSGKYDPEGEPIYCDVATTFLETLVAACSNMHSLSQNEGRIARVRRRAGAGFRRPVHSRADR
jgi:hypothetical protein